MRKITYIKQTDLKDCGVACLISIVNYYGGNVSREYLRELTKTTKEGVSVYSLIEAGFKLGFDTKAVRSKILRLKDEVPLIAHVIINKKYGHFVVVTKILDTEIEVMDPDGGFKKYGLSAWKNISTDVYLLYRPRTEILKQAPDKSFFKLIFPILEKYKFFFLTMFLFSLVFTICNILISYEFQFFLDLVANDNFKTLNYIFLFLVIVILLKELTNLFRNNLINYVNHELDKNLLHEVYNHIIKLPYLYFKNRTKGDVITRIQDIFTVRDVISKLLVTIVVDLVLVITVSIFLFKISFKLGIGVVIITLIYIFIIMIYNNLIKDKIKDMKEKEIEVNNHLIESLNSVNTIKGMQIEDVLSDKLYFKYKNFQDTSFSLYKNHYEELFFKELIYGLGILLILYFGVREVIKNNLTLPRLLVFNSLLTYFFTPIINICNLELLIREAMVSFTRIKELLNIPAEELLLDKKVSTVKFKGNIKVSNLHYSYNGINDILNCKELEIKSKEHVLLYGISGGGKSTLMKIIARYIENYEGNIFIDDRKLYDYNLKEIRKRITYLSQDETIFTDTIYNNIVLNYDIAYEEYLKIIELTGVDEILSRSILKDNMLLFENANNLSGGERQRILLARALLKKSDIYIFDESFNALDIKNERVILEKVLNYLKEKTVIVISHRFNNQDLYQKIILVKKGEIYEY